MKVQCVNDFREPTTATATHNLANTTSVRGAPEYNGTEMSFSPTSHQQHLAQSRGRKSDGEEKAVRQQWKEDAPARMLRVADTTNINDTTAASHSGDEGSQSGSSSRRRSNHTDASGEFSSEAGQGSASYGSPTSTLEGGGVTHSSPSQAPPVISILHTSSSTHSAEQKRSLASDRTPLSLGDNDNSLQRIDSGVATATNSAGSSFSGLQSAHDLSDQQLGSLLSRTKPTATGHVVSTRHATANNAVGSLPQPTHHHHHASTELPLVGSMYSNDQSLSIDGGNPISPTNRSDVNAASRSTSRSFSANNRRQGVTGGGGGGGVPGYRVHRSGRHASNQASSHRTGSAVGNDVQSDVSGVSADRFVSFSVIDAGEERKDSSHVSGPVSVNMNPGAGGNGHVDGGITSGDVSEVATEIAACESGQEHPRSKSKKQQSTASTFLSRLRFPLRMTVLLILFVSLILNSSIVLFFQGRYSAQQHQILLEQEAKSVAYEVESLLMRYQALFQTPLSSWSGRSRVGDLKEMEDAMTACDAEVHNLTKRLEFVTSNPLITMLLHRSTNLEVASTYKEVFLKYHTNVEAASLLSAVSLKYVNHVCDASLQLSPKFIVSKEYVGLGYDVTIYVHYYVWKKGRIPTKWANTAPNEQGDVVVAPSDYKGANPEHTEPRTVVTQLYAIKVNDTFEIRGDATPTSQTVYSDRNSAHATDLVHDNKSSFMLPTPGTPVNLGRMSWYLAPEKHRFHARQQQSDGEESAQESIHTAHESVDSYYPVFAPAHPISGALNWFTGSGSNDDNIQKVALTLLQPLLNLEGKHVFSVLLSMQSSSLRSIVGDSLGIGDPGNASFIAAARESTRYASSSLTPADIAHSPSSSVSSRDAAMLEQLGATIDASMESGRRRRRLERFRYVFLSDGLVASSSTTSTLTFPEPFFSPALLDDVLNRNGNDYNATAIAEQLTKRYSDSEHIPLPSPQLNNQCFTTNSTILFRDSVKPPSASAQSMQHVNLCLLRAEDLANELELPTTLVTDGETSYRRFSNEDDHDLFYTKATTTRTYHNFGGVRGRNVVAVGISLSRERSLVKGNSGMRLIIFVEDAANIEKVEADGYGQLGRCASLGVDCTTYPIMVRSIIIVTSVIVIGLCIIYALLTYALRDLNTISTALKRVILTLEFPKSKKKRASERSKLAVSGGSASKSKNTIDDADTNSQNSTNGPNIGGNSSTYNAVNDEREHKEAKALEAVSSFTEVRELQKCVQQLKKTMARVVPFIPSFARELFINRKKRTLKKQRQLHEHRQKQRFLDMLRTGKPSGNGGGGSGDGGSGGGGGSGDAGPLRFNRGVPEDASNSNTSSDDDALDDQIAALFSHHQYSASGYGSIANSTANLGGSAFANTSSTGRLETIKSKSTALTGVSLELAIKSKRATNSLSGAGGGGGGETGGGAYSSIGGGSSVGGGAATYGGVPVPSSSLTTRVTCVAIRFDLLHPQFSSERLQLFIQHVAPLAEKYGGVIDCIRSMSMFISFNFVRPCPTHEEQACAFAVAVEKTLKHLAQIMAISMPPPFDAQASRRRQSKNTAGKKANATSGLTYVPRSAQARQHTQRNSKQGNKSEETITMQDRSLRDQAPYDESFVGAVTIGIDTSLGKSFYYRSPDDEIKYMLLLASAYQHAEALTTSATHMKATVIATNRTCEVARSAFLVLEKVRLKSNYVCLIEDLVDNAPTTTAALPAVGTRSTSHTLSQQVNGGNDALTSTHTNFQCVLCELIGGVQYDSFSPESRPWYAAGFQLLSCGDYEEASLIWSTAVKELERQLQECARKQRLMGGTTMQPALQPQPHQPTVNVGSNKRAPKQAQQNPSSSPPQSEAQDDDGGVPLVDFLTDGGADGAEGTNASGNGANGADERTSLDAADDQTSLTPTQQLHITDFLASMILSLERDPRPLEVLLHRAHLMAAAAKRLLKSSDGPRAQGFVHCESIPWRLYPAETPTGVFVPQHHHRASTIAAHHRVGADPSRNPLAPPLQLASTPGSNGQRRLSNGSNHTTPGGANHSGRSGSWASTSGQSYEDPPLHAVIHPSSGNSNVSNPNRTLDLGNPNDLRTLLDGDCGGAGGGR